MIRQLMWGVVFIVVSFGLLQGDLHSRKHSANAPLITGVPTSRATQAVERTPTAAMVPYPEGYRAWAHVKSALVSSRHPDFENTGGFRHIYANAQAMAGYRSGTFLEGSIIVVDWLEGRDENGMFTEGPQRRLDVMVKDRARFAATGGWGFERFQAASRTERAVTSAASQCFACHSGQGTRDMVFSKLRE
jgi:Cytochrome P460